MSKKSERKLKAEKRAVVVSIAFLVITAVAMVADAYSPGQTRAQAEDAYRTMEVRCAAATASGTGLVERTLACMPPRMKRADEWLTLGVLGLGILMIGAAVAAKREADA